LLDVGFVVAIHDEIIAELGGLPGFAGSGIGGVGPHCIASQIARTTTG